MGDAALTPALPSIGQGVGPIADAWPGHVSLFEITSSSGEPCLCSLDAVRECEHEGAPARGLPERGPGLGKIPTLSVGRGPRGRVDFGGPARIIAPLTCEQDCHTVAQDLAGTPVDMVEWRVDLYEPFQQAADAEARMEATRQGLDTVCERSLVPVLATIRAADEGGMASLAPPEYAHLLTLLATQADLVDVQIEAFGDEAAAAAIIEQLHEAGAGVVASYHNFTLTPPEEELVECMRRMARCGADIAKIACRVDGPDAALRVMNTQIRARHELRKPIIGIGMGHAAALTRIGGLSIGSAATFASMRGASAPGQFTAQQVRQALDVLEEGCAN